MGDPTWACICQCDYTTWIMASLVVGTLIGILFMVVVEWVEDHQVDPLAGLNDDDPLEPE